jgi:hypothetical protein
VVKTDRRLRALAGAVSLLAHHWSEIGVREP